MSPRSLVWVTRAQPGAQATAARLRALGFEPLVSPVLEIRPLAARIDLQGMAALAFTSANAVRAFAGLEPGRGLPAFAVGEATAKAALEAGFTEVEAADGDVTALAGLLAARAPGPVLNPTAAEPAADLAALLAGSGVEVKRVAVYEAVAAEPARALAALADISAVLVHSPRAARRLCALLDRESLARLDFACISGAAAGPLADTGAGRVRAAPFPEESALLRLLSAEPS